MLATGHVHRSASKPTSPRGVRSGVNGTPTFFINGEQRHYYGFDFDDLVCVIDAQLVQK